MCILEPPTPITAAPNALTDYFPADNHFESLLVCATIISDMGNIPPPSPRPSISSEASNATGYAGTGGMGGVAALAMFILGGPMPPTPGLIPLCWEDLIDWTNDARVIAEEIYQRTNDESDLNNLLPAVGLAIKTIRGVRFVPQVSVQETDAALKKLASLSYMDRAQFYQESVVIAVKSEEDEEVLCFISLSFNFVVISHSFVASLTLSPWSWNTNPLLLWIH